MELKLQDYEIGDLININNAYIAVITEIDKFSLKAIALNYPHRQDQIFVITEKYVNSITKVIHE